MNKKWWLVLLSGVWVLNSAWASELALPTLTVRGQAELSAAADFASFSIGVQNNAVLAETALDANSRLMGQLQQTLQKAGLSDKAMSSHSFSVQPQWSARPRGAEAGWTASIVGYQVRSQLLIETDRLENVASFIQSGVDVGANVVSQLHFSLKEDDELYHQALRQATVKARQQAEVAASAAGVELGDLYRIDVSPQQPLPYQRLNAAPMARMAMDSPSPVVVPGEIEVRADVQLTYRLQ
ncbi:MAG: SIMPL domain-containing protein [Halopseudomonas sp.]